ncbi:MAG TPA: Wzz/FepE/Etk N-terminal domain-containing protein [Candidatus Bathyarchaeia archaeon]|nr:Wzz/FepE/Etk N-terminal domain-containing protein [Candidatus Bathyarchaeia archaeon]
MELIMDIWRSVRKRFLLVLVIPVIAGISAVVASVYILTPVYQATSTIIVQPQNTANMNMYNSVMGNQQLMKTYAELIRSHRIAQEVIDELGVTKSVGQLLDQVEVKVKNGTFLIDITVSDQSQEEAARYANMFSQVISMNSAELLNSDNILVIDKAELNENAAPASPKPYQNAAIAVAFGLLIGVGLALSAELWERYKREAKLQGNVSV